MPAMTIGSVARAAGVGIETIRYYERLGLIAPPPRSPSGYRRYQPDAVATIGFIKRAQRLGFTLTEIADLLELHEDPVPCDEIRRRAEAKVAEIDERIAGLSAVKNSLAALIGRCETACAAACTVLLDDAPRGSSTPAPASCGPAIDQVTHRIEVAPGTCGSGCDRSD